MKRMLKIYAIVVCVLLTTTLFAKSTSRLGNVEQKSKLVVNNTPTPYRPSLRQGGVLFVEDPGDPGFGPATKPDPVWQGLLDSILGAGNYGWYGATSTPGEDGPPLDTLLDYELVIWNTYDYWWQDTASLTVNDQNNLGAFLDNGGKVWLIGQDALYSGVPLSWMTAYFHLASANQDYAFPADSMNMAGLAELAGLNTHNVPDYQSNPFYPDELIPDAQAHAVLEDTDSSKVVGIFYPGAGDWVTAFWAVDGRTCTPYDQWWQMVYNMLEAFGVLSVGEIPHYQPTRSLKLTIAPVIFTNSTSINFNLPTNGEVKLCVYNKTGQRIITLIDEYKYAGSYSTAWNRKYANGNDVPDGVYFVNLSCDGMSCTKNVVVVK